MTAKTSAAPLSETLKLKDTFLHMYNSSLSLPTRLLKPNSHGAAWMDTKTQPVQVGNISTEQNSGANPGLYLSAAWTCRDERKMETERTRLPADFWNQYLPCREGLNRDAIALHCGNCRIHFVRAWPFLVSKVNNVSIMSLTSASALCKSYTTSSSPNTNKYYTLPPEFSDWSCRGKEKAHSL